MMLVVPPVLLLSQLTATHVQVVTTKAPPTPHVFSVILLDTTQALRTVYPVVLTVAPVRVHLLTVILALLERT